MKNIIILAAALLFVSNNIIAQKAATGSAKPKLVVGIVIDQMRWDYLYRYADRYSNDGFKRMMNEGFNCQNTFINYIPTYTAAGHTAVYTGSVPALHGIMGNSWYSRVLNRNVYCTEDSTVSSVGSTSTAGQMSPVNLWSTTISDEMRLATNFKSKVIGIALKDRGAILPAGHSANAAYWFDNHTGSFITSSYYMKELPTWVKNFNDKKLPDQYLQMNWNTLYPINTYEQSSIDNKIYESKIPNEDNTFPHITANITKDKYNSFRYTPYGNTYTLEMAKAAIEGEQLGQDGVTDMLAVSFSSPDYIGHEFGPNSIEAEDTYLRLDKDLESFFKYLDKKIGKGEYLAFLTADHGVAHIPGYLRENKIPAGVLDDKDVENHLNKVLLAKFNIKDAVSRIINYQAYINYNAVNANDMAKVKQTIINELLTFPAIASAFDLTNMPAMPMPEQLKKRIANGYNQRLSGDILFIYKPHYFDGWDKGTTHGVWNAYDSHIPLLWYGWGIKKGQTYKETYMTDIAVTLAALLKIQMPSAAIGEAIEEVMK